LIGHLDNLSSSTQNQIYKHIAAKLLDSRDISSKYTTTEKAIVEEYLSESTLTMHVYLLEEFEYKATDNEHTEKRRIAQLFEKQVIQSFVNNRKKQNLMNKKISICKDNPTTCTEQFKAIQKDFNLAKN
jgi:hypothetical protein